MSLPDCCFKGFAWEGSPTGKTTTINTNQTYVAGSNPKVAFVIVHDILGWTWKNTRLLADHFAVEIGATVYLPDFFGGESVKADLVLEGRWADMDLPAFLSRNSPQVREPEMVALIQTLRARGFEKVGAIGYCYGGWAMFRLAGIEVDGKKLVDCVSVGHPSLVEKAHIDGVRHDVPVQVLAPEHDVAYTEELKMHTFVTLQKLGVPFDYQHFAGAEHGCLTKADEKKSDSKAVLVRGKNAAVAWARQWLYDAEARSLRGIFTS
jgi:dienelactone hydrolase